MVEAHPLPHCKGITPTQAENQLAKPPFLAGQSCPGCSHVACAAERGSHALQAAQGQCGFLQQRPRYERERSCGSQPYRLGKRQLSAFSWSQGKTSWGAVLEETFPGFPIGWGHSLGLVHRPSSLACRGLKARAIAPDTS